MSQTEVSEPDGRRFALGIGRVCGEAIAALRHGWLTADPYGVSLVQSQPPARINLPQIESTANKTEDQCHSLPVTVTHSRLLDTRGVSWQ